MDKINKISFIIPVRDRDIKRIRNCVTSLKSKYTGEIIIVDYGSKNPIKAIRGTKVIRYNKNPIWNKAHAINLGIRKAKFDYIGTVDCDMIISPEFIKCANKHLYKNSFIYSLNVKRIEIKDTSSNFNDMVKLASYWFGERSRKNINHSANGGIQIYSKKWIVDICGVDESLIYWGAVDNDTFERAVMCGMNMINLNIPILHQEHKLKKEEHLSGVDAVNAFWVRNEKIQYLNEMFIKNKYIRNSGKWGLIKPNQGKFLRSDKWVKKNTDKQVSDEEEYSNSFVKAAKAGKSSFKFNGVKFNIFK